MDAHNLAQIAAISSSFWLSGMRNIHLLLGRSARSLGGLFNLPAFYHKGHSLGPPFAILGAGGFVWLALESGCWLYWRAAILDVGIVPYTFAFVIQTNSSIFEIANVKDSSEKPASEENRLAPLLNRGACLNTVRSLFPLAGGILGLVAAFMCRIGFLHPGKQCHNPLVHGSKALDSTPSVEIVDIQNDAQALPVHFLDPGTADMYGRYPSDSISAGPSGDSKSIPSLANDGVGPMVSTFILHFL
ncbi:hypothetical protein N7534_008219 [Penicillium rubens]|nr:hypothetical protein N7534_008219 [Penicillium rubens]